jgi:two-component system sensor histidine kinase PilS (NtrC family)
MRIQGGRSKWLLRLIWVRIVVFSTFIAVQPSVDLLVLLAAVYALSLCWFGLLRLNHSYLGQAYGQIGVDLLLITWMVNRTGGLDSYFSSLYFLTIVMSSLLLKRRGAYLTAITASMLHGVHLDLMYFRVLPSTTVAFPQLATLQYIVGITIFGFCAVGFLANALAENWHTSDAALEESTGQVAFLEALTAHIIDSLGSGLVTTDLKGKIFLFNPAAARILGRRSERVVGHQIREIFPTLPEDRVEGQFEVETLDSEGRQLSLQFSVTPLVLGQKGRTGHVWCFDDVTDVREMERELRRKERMAAIGVMSAGIAHEIRNPLASISGSFDLLQSGLELGPEQKQLVGIIARETERLNQTINNFLMYARPNPPQLEELRLDVLIADALRLIENSTIRRADQQIRTDLTQVTVMADEGMVRQVVYNLASNAFKAMPDGGTLEITLRETGGFARLEFRDSGIGMGAEEMDNLFLPFHSSFRSGTGLGLSIVYQIVTAHKGRIWVNSKPGGGALFTLEFATVLEVFQESDASRSHAPVSVHGL